MVFQFEHVVQQWHETWGKWRPKPFDLVALKRVLSRWQYALADDGWNSLFWGNHDLPRTVSKYGDDKAFRVESAKMLAIALHFLKGTPYVYQGEEIGMTNVAFESIEEYRDVETLNMYKEMVNEKGLDPKEVLKIVRAKSRDNARTPMQWDANEQAGFTKGVPWIKVNPNYKEINVSQALGDPNSVFYYYQKLIQLRRENPVIVYGAYDLILDSHEEIYAFTRTLDDDRLLVILNFGANSPIFNLPENIHFVSSTLLIGNYKVDSPNDVRKLTLRPYEARVYRLR